MGRKRRYIISKHVALDKLDSIIKETEMEMRVLRRLYFIRNVYVGDSVEKSIKKAKITKATGYEWLRRWNESGYGGLMPHFGGGRPSKLSAVQKDDLLSVLMKKNNWTIISVRDLVKKRYDILYSYNQTRRLVASLGMKSSKAYSRYYRY